MILAKPVKALKERKRIKRTARPRQKRKTSLAALKRKLWALFARYVKDRDGNRCFSCGATGLEGPNWHAAHLISIRKASTAYDPDNVFSGCAGCNVFQRGNIAEYTMRYLDRFGEAKFRALVQRSRVHRQWKPADLEGLIAAIEKSGADYEMYYAQAFGGVR